MSILIYGTPEIVLFAGYGHEHLVDEPVIAEQTLAASECPLIAGSELEAPPTYGVVGDDDTALGEEILDVPKAQAESMVGPDCLADDVWRKSVTAVSGFSGVHQLRMPRARLP